MPSISERLKEHHNTLWGHNSSTESIMTEAARRIETLEVALKPFADVIDIFDSARSDDRDLRMATVTVHANSNATGACLKTLTEKNFKDAHAALAVT